MREIRKRSYDIMKFNLEKRLSDAELPIAGLFLWALVHGLELLLIDGQVVRGEYRKGIVHRVLQLAGPVSTALGREGLARILRR